MAAPTWPFLSGFPTLSNASSNLVNLLLDSTATANRALLSIAAAVAEVALPRLPGLADQAPDSDLLKTLQRPADADRNFAYQANFEPTGNLVDWVKNAAIDRIFATSQTTPSSPRTVFPGHVRLQIANGLNREFWPERWRASYLFFQPATDGENRGVFGTAVKSPAFFFW